MNLGSRMKNYERHFTTYCFEKGDFIIMRLDGQHFHTLTRKFEKPFDEIFTIAMTKTAEKLHKEFNARITYTQSDEISMLIHITDIKSEIKYGGKAFKLLSASAAFCSVHFSQILNSLLITNAKNNLLDLVSNKQFKFTPTFDSRVFTVPNKEEVCNYFLWRNRDCIKNSISSLANLYFSDKKLFQKHQEDRLEMLKTLGIDWNDIQPQFKYGTFLRSKKTEATFSDSEIEKLPKFHMARKNKNLTFERTRVVVDHLDFANLENKDNFIFSKRWE